MAMMVVVCLPYLGKCVVRTYFSFTRMNHSLLVADVAGAPLSHI